jgi:hypothetical protein
MMSDNWRMLTGLYNGYVSKYGRERNSLVKGDGNHRYPHPFPFSLQLARYQEYVKRGNRFCRRQRFPFSFSSAAAADDDDMISLTWNGKRWREGRKSENERGGRYGGRDSRGDRPFQY